MSLPAHFLGQLPSYDQARGGGKPQAIGAQGEATLRGLIASGLPQCGSAGLFDFSLSHPVSFLLSQVWIPKERLQSQISSQHLFSRNQLPATDLYSLTPNFRKILLGLETSSSPKKP